MGEEYSRRKQQRPTSTSNPTLFIVILLLLVNTLILGTLVFLNVQATSKQETTLNSIEKQINKLEARNDRQVSTTDSSGHSVLGKSSSTQVGKVTASSSTTVSSSQPVQSTSSSESVESEPTTEPSETPVATNYTVQPGDTLSLIAEKNNLSLQDLMTKNNLSDSTVYVGQVLSLQ